MGMRERQSANMSSLHLNDKSGFAFIRDHRYCTMPHEFFQVTRQRLNIVSINKRRDVSLTLRLHSDGVAQYDNLLFWAAHKI
ncbi:MAG: hypothetical protein A2Z57_04455 [Planctomycetes bacterium RIFCSPHIGHO2_12_39_6]|nr:MAG: hypothetical protein A2Z57_04455 [Planctomycetes bacterium RIFCSPHIGHO2_12_39_6]